MYEKPQNNVSKDWLNVENRAQNRARFSLALNKFFEQLFLSEKNALTSRSREKECRSKERHSLLLWAYVCTEQLFDSWLFMYDKTILKKLINNLIAHIFTLLLAPFVFKLDNYSRHSESLNIAKSTTVYFKTSDLSIFKHSSKARCALNNWRKRC